MRRWGWLLVILSAWLLVACGGGEASTNEAAGETAAAQPTVTAPTSTLPVPTATPTPEPTPLPTPTPTTAEASAERPMFHLPTDLADIQDARLHYVVRVRVEEGSLPQVEQNDAALVEWTMELTREPPARHIVMEGMLAALGAAMTGNEAPQVELIQVEDQMWVRVGDQWLLAAQQEPPSVDQDLESVLQITALGDLEPQERVTVNGFETVRYHTEWNAAVIDEPATFGFLDSFLAAFGAREDVDIQPEQVVLDIFATDDDLIVKAVYQIQHHVTQNDQSATLVEEIVFEVQSINTGITIEPPADAAATTLDIPLPEGATLQSMFAGTYVYVVPGATLDDVVAFYDEALPQNGFTITQRVVMSGQGGLLQAEKEGRVYQVVIGADAEGQTSITLLQSE